jgi:hypothetical protein
LGKVIQNQRIVQLCNKLFAFHNSNYPLHNLAGSDARQAAVVSVSAFTFAIDGAGTAFHIELDVIMGILAIALKTACG